MGYEIFERLCMENQVTASKVSRATGIATATLTNWKQGKYTPKSDKLQKIADYFGVSLEYLMTGNEQERESISGKSYYFDDDTAETAQKTYECKDLRMLFDSARGSSSEDLRMAADLLRRLKKTNLDG